MAKRTHLIHSNRRKRGRSWGPTMHSEGTLPTVWQPPTRPDLSTPGPPQDYKQGLEPLTYEPLRSVHRSKCLHMHLLNGMRKSQYCVGTTQIVSATICVSLGMIQSIHPQQGLRIIRRGEVEHTGDMPTSNPHPAPACRLPNFSSICSFVWQDNRKVAQQSVLDLSETLFKACKVGKIIYNTPGCFWVLQCHVLDSRISN